MLKTLTGLVLGLILLFQTAYAYDVSARALWISYDAVQITVIAPDIKSACFTVRNSDAPMGHHIGCTIVNPLTPNVLVFTLDNRLADDYLIHVADGDEYRVDVVAGNTVQQTEWFPVSNLHPLQGRGPYTIALPTIAR